jgi:hypothetical protein
LPIIAVQYPKEKWRKVNVSKFLSQFKKVEASSLVEVPEENLQHVLQVLERNSCKVTVLPVVSTERHIVTSFLHILREVREGKAQPKQLADFAAKIIAEKSLEKMDEDLAELLHDAIDFEDNPSIILLNNMENAARQIEKRIP